MASSTLVPKEQNRRKTQGGQGGKYKGTSSGTPGVLYTDQLQGPHTHIEEVLPDNPQQARVQQP
eukprot:12890094-Prorocentrum_lima.AAC.1